MSDRLRSRRRVAERAATAYDVALVARLRLALYTAWDRSDRAVEVFLGFGAIAARYRRLRRVALGSQGPRLLAMIASIPSAGDALSKSGERPTATRSSS